MSNISAWSATAASNTATPPDGAPENMAASGVNDCIREVMASVRRWYVDAEWVDWGHTPTRVDNDTFTVATDLTATYHAGRRLKVTGSATGYCTIASSSYSAPNTTVNVTMDSGNLPGTLSAVYVALLSGSNISVPLLSAAILTSGSLADARLSSNVPLKDAANTFSGSNVFSTNQTISPASAANLYTTWSVAGTPRFYIGDGTSIGGTAGNLYVRSNNGLDLGAGGNVAIGIATTGNVTVNAPGSGTSLQVSSIDGQWSVRQLSGTVEAGSYISGDDYIIGTASADDVVIRANGTGRIRVGSAGGTQLGSPTGGDKGAGTLNTAGAIYQNNVAVALSNALDASALTSGTVPDARFPATLPAASGANLTALNASNLASGTVPDARFPATLPAASGANLTALNATNIASGTVADARLSANVPLQSTGSFTATLTGMSGATTGTINYRVVGNVAHLWLAAQISGTSNADTFTITGMPAAIRPGADRVLLMQAIDNNAFANSQISVGSGGTATLVKLGGAGSWTTSGTKGLYAGTTISYPLD